jgi:hypothetical protein
MDTSPLLLKLQQMLEMYALKASPEYLASTQRLIDLNTSRQSAGLPGLTEQYRADQLRGPQHSLAWSALNLPPSSSSRKCLRNVGSLILS